MRILLSIITLVLMTTCSSEKTVDIENDIFISSFDTSSNSTEKSSLKDSVQAIRLSKDFWNYFIRTHAKTSAIIFLMPLYDTNNNYVSLPDTSYSFYNVDLMSSFFLSKLLADSVTGKEKENRLGHAFFVVPDDTSGLSAKHKRIQQKLSNYKITADVRKEFDRLKSILTWRDTSEHYVIVFKKAFADKIYKLYE